MEGTGDPEPAVPAPPGRARRPPPPASSTSLSRPARRGGRRRPARPAGAPPWSRRLPGAGPPGRQHEGAVEGGHRRRPAQRHDPTELALRTTRAVQPPPRLPRWPTTTAPDGRSAPRGLPWRAPWRRRRRGGRRRRRRPRHARRRPRPPLPARRRWPVRRRAGGPRGWRRRPPPPRPPRTGRRRRPASTPFTTTGRPARPASHPTSSKVRAGSNSPVTTAMNPPSRARSVLEAARLGSARSSGRCTPPRTSRRRSPETGASTVSTRASNPAAAARATISAVRPRSRST